MGRFAYVYYDVSWILTLGWTGLISLAVIAGDYFFKTIKERTRFFVYLVIATILGLLGEAWVVGIGIRTYAPEVANILININIPLLKLPIESLYYIPVFMSLIIAFYKYWDLHLSKKIILPINKNKWIRNLIIAIIGVLLYEVMIEPMVINANLPNWSYIYHDISFIITLGWVFLIYVSTSIVDYFMIKENLVKRFIAYLVLLTVITIPIENFLVATGVRQYGESLTNNFMGFMVPGTVLAFEVLFAIPLYLALVITFVRYWEIILDNKN
ncbi:MAG: hypothetical protein CMI53_01000 [Parcubacteria group bacterium]|nr:hypothetical protein [Parcubacteria group bacterium]|tara:strand:- start:415 stop:1224 length:810 start_codon:yes stop_codon:yes gene_type:complete